jgi:hypothetical protein
VPVQLQAALVAKVAAYDAHFRSRARDNALVLIVVASNSAESLRFGEEIRAQLAHQPTIGGLPHTEELVSFSSAQDLSRLCNERRPAIVYLAPGLSAHTTAIADGFTGLDVLTVAAVADDVRSRIALGFTIESGRPKLLVHLTQARRQHVAFNPNLLRLARVIE